MKIIGLTGFAKSGKSTAAEILKSLGGQEIAFAKHLKDVCSVIFGVPRDHFDDQAFKEVKFGFDRIIMRIDIENILKYFEIPARFIPETMLKHEGVRLTTPRHVAQYIGTEVLRAIDQDIHINMAFKLASGSDANFLICSDVRFENELKAVQKADGLMIGISREAAMPKDLVNLHPSEKEIPDLISSSNIIIKNETTISDLQRMVQENTELFLANKKGPVGATEPTKVFTESRFL